MEKLESHDMDKYEYDYNHNSINGDRRRAPQLNRAVPGQGGMSQGGQDIGEGGEDSHRSEANSNEECTATHQRRYVEEDNLSEDGTQSVDGEEGREDMHIKIPGYGYITFKAIFTALARHDECECHTRPLPGPRRLSDSGTPEEPIMQSMSSSMVVEHHNSDDQNPENSAMWITRSQTPSEFDFSIGSLFPPTQLVFNPLPLSAELIFARGDGPFHYPLDISFTEHEEDENEKRDFPF